MLILDVLILLKNAVVSLYNTSIDLCALPALLWVSFFKHYWSFIKELRSFPIYMFLAPLTFIFSIFYVLIQIWAILIPTTIVWVLLRNEGWILSILVTLVVMAGYLNVVAKHLDVPPEYHVSTRKTFYSFLASIYLLILGITVWRLPEYWRFTRELDSMPNNEFQSHHPKRTHLVFQEFSKLWRDILVLPFLLIAVIPFWRWPAFVRAAVTFIAGCESNSKSSSSSSSSSDGDEIRLSRSRIMLLALSTPQEIVGFFLALVIILTGWRSISLINKLKSNSSFEWGSIVWNEFIEWSKEFPIILLLLCLAVSVYRFIYLIQDVKKEQKSKKSNNDNTNNNNNNENDNNNNNIDEKETDIGFKQLLAKYTIIHFIGLVLDPIILISYCFIKITVYRSFIINDTKHSSEEKPIYLSKRRHLILIQMRKLIFDILAHTLIAPLILVSGWRAKSLIQAWKNAPTLSKYRSIFHQFVEFIKDVPCIFCGLFSLLTIWRIFKWKKILKQNLSAQILRRKALKSAVGPFQDVIGILSLVGLVLTIYRLLILINQIKEKMNSETRNSISMNEFQQLLINQVLQLLMDIPFFILFVINLLFFWRIVYCVKELRMVSDAQSRRKIVWQCFKIGLSETPYMISRFILTCSVIHYPSMNLALRYFSEAEKKVQIIKLISYVFKDLPYTWMCYCIIFTIYRVNLVISAIRPTFQQAETTLEENVLQETTNLLRNRRQEENPNNNVAEENNEQETQSTLENNEPHSEQNISNSSTNLSSDIIGPLLSECIEIKLNILKSAVATHCLLIFADFLCIIGIGFIYLVRFENEDFQYEIRSKKMLIASADFWTAAEYHITVKNYVIKSLQHLSKLRIIGDLLTTIMYTLLVCLSIYRIRYIWYRNRIGFREYSFSSLVKTQTKEFISDLPFLSIALMSTLVNPFNITKLYRALFKLDDEETRRRRLASIASSFLVDVSTCFISITLLIFFWRIPFAYIDITQRKLAFRKSVFKHFIGGFNDFNRILRITAIAYAFVTFPEFLHRLYHFIRYSVYRFKLETSIPVDESELSDEQLESRREGRVLDDNVFTHNVLPFLKGEEVSRLSLVCRHWYNQCQDSALWHNLYQSLEYRKGLRNLPQNETHQQEDSSYSEFTSNFTNSFSFEEHTNWKAAYKTLYLNTLESNNSVIHLVEKRAEQDYALGFDSFLYNQLLNCTFYQKWFIFLPIMIYALPSFLLNRYLRWRVIKSTSQREEIRYIDELGEKRPQEHLFLNEYRIFSFKLLQYALKACIGLVLLSFHDIGVLLNSTIGNIFAKMYTFIMNLDTQHNNLATRLLNKTVKELFLLFINLLLVVVIILIVPFFWNVLPVSGITWLAVNIPKLWPIFTIRGWQGFFILHIATFSIWRVISTIVLFIFRSRILAFIGLYILWSTFWIKSLFSLLDNDSRIRSYDPISPWKTLPKRSYRNYVWILIFATQNWKDKNTLGEILLFTFTILWIFWPLLLPTFLGSSLWFIPSGTLSCLLIVLATKTIKRYAGDNTRQ